MLLGQGPAQLLGLWRGFVHREVTRACMGTETGWSLGKGVSLWLGKPWANSVLCLIPFIGAMEMLMPPGGSLGLVLF